MVGSDDDARATLLAKTAIESMTQAVPLPASASSVSMPATIGRYQLVDRLGAGAMGVVWSAIDPQLERKVAIKVVHPRLATTPDASIRILREARAMAKLSHRAVVTVYDAGEVNEQLFLTMELIDGETLTARLQRPDLARPSAWRQRLALVLEAGRGLAAAHAAGVLHRDFKPDNVLVDRGGRVCVGDFGLATLGELARAHPQRPGAQDLMLTTTGALLGTPVYMSPQQLRGLPADARADQFAFCVTAYEAIYGVRPFACDITRGLEALPDLIETIEAGTFTPPPPDHLVPDAVGDVLRRGLAADSAVRWPDLDALLLALDTASGMRARRRRRAAIGVTSVAAIAIAAGAGAFAYAHSSPVIVVQPSRRALFHVAMQSQIALGPGGRKIAVANDRIDVYDPDRRAPHTLPLAPPWSNVRALELDADEVVFSTFAPGLPAHWHYDGPSEPMPTWTGDRTWVGRLGTGDIYIVGRDIDVTGFVYVRDGHDIASWPATSRDAQVVATSPDGAHFAYSVDTRRGGEIHVVDPDGSQRTYPAIYELTALAWRDDDTLLVARGTTVEPTISALPLVRDGFGPIHEIYRQQSGWFARLASRDGRTVFVDASPTSRVRVVSRVRDSIRDHEPSRIAGEIGWLPTGELLTWNRITRHLERYTGAMAAVDTQVELAGEPINATSAGDVWIVTTRGVASREISAFDLATHAERWRVHDGSILAVRCTNDRAPPCVAIRPGATDDEVVAIDPETGATGAVLTHAPSIDDVAVRADGHLLVVGRSHLVRELDATGAVVASYNSTLATVRSVAITVDGGILIGGTARGNTYTFGELVGEAFMPLVISDTELCQLVRPSPDGSQVAIVARSFAPELEELVLP